MKSSEEERNNTDSLNEENIDKYYSLVFAKLIYPTNINQLILLQIKKNVMRLYHFDLAPTDQWQNVFYQ